MNQTESNNQQNSSDEVASDESVQQGTNWVNIFTWIGIIIGAISMSVSSSTGNVVAGAFQGAKGGILGGLVGALVGAIVGFVIKSSTRK